jgi:hypothetical protein
LKLERMKVEAEGCIVKEWEDCNSRLEQVRESWRWTDEMETKDESDVAQNWSKENQARGKIKK